MSHRAQTRVFALVGALTGERRAIHTGNFPLVPEKMLPVADVVILVADDDPGAMLFRYTAYGEFGGDTWHLTVEEAQESAIYEYGDKFHLNYSCYFGNDNFGYGEQFCGNEGTVEVLNRSLLRFTPQSFAGKPLANRKEAVVELVGNDNLAVEAHIRNLVETIQGKAQLVAPVEIGQQAAVSGHMATLALRNKKMVRWDVKSRKAIIG